MSGAERSLGEALGVLSDPDHADSLLVERTLQTARRKSPVLGDLLIAAAIPRIFDRLALQRMTDTDADDAEFQRAWRLLVAYPFIHERVGDGYAVHDSIRQPLLAWSKRTPESREQAGQYAERLAAHYRDQWGRARTALDHLSDVAAVIQATDLERYQQLSESIQDRCVRGATDIVHLCLQSDPSSYEECWDVFFQTESAGAHLLEVLVRSFGEDIADAPDDLAAELQGWLAYWSARLASNRSQFDDALAALDAAPPVDDLKLRTWMYSARAAAFRGRWDMDQALDALEAEIQIHRTDDPDPYNSSTAWAQKADIFGFLWQQRDERDALRDALVHADAVSNHRVAASLEVRLAELQSSMGEGVAGFHDLLSAVWRARRMVGDTSRAEDRLVSLDVCSTGLELLGPSSARLLDLLVEQARQLSTPDGAEGRLNLLLTHASSHADGGNRERARRLFDEARSFAEDHVPEQAWRVDFELLQRSLDLGLAAEGAQLLAGVEKARDVSLDPWRLGVARINAGICLMLTGEGDRGLVYVRQARAAWERLQHRLAVNVSWAIEADILRRSGQLAAAERALEVAGDEPARGYEGYRLETAARLALERMDLQRAVSLAAEALQSATGAGSNTTYLQRGVLALECLLLAGEHARAADLATDLSERARRLQTFVDHRPTIQTETADQHAARAVRILTTGYGSRTARIRSAKEHLEEAKRQDPGFGWLDFELALLDLLLGHVDAARSHLEAASAWSPLPELRAAISDLAAELLPAG